MESTVLSRTMEKAIKRGIDIEAPDADGNTYLHRICARGCAQSVRLMIKNKACLDTKSRVGYAALHIAVMSASLEIVDLLLNAGADVCVTTPAGTTALMYAAKLDNAPIAERLIKGGARVNDCDYGTLNTALHIAAAYNSAAVCNLLLDNGAKIDVKSQNGSTPLAAALSMKADNGLVELLLTRGASATMADNDGWTPLHIATILQLSLCATMLLEHGARMDCLDKHQISPSMIVSRTPDCVQMTSLLSHPTSSLPLPPGRRDRKSVV